MQDEPEYRWYCPGCDTLLCADTPVAINEAGKRHIAQHEEAAVERMIVRDFMAAGHLVAPEPIAASTTWPRAPITPAPAGNAGDDASFLRDCGIKAEDL